MLLGSLETSGSLPSTCPLRSTGFEASDKRKGFCFGVSFFLFFSFLWVSFAGFPFQGWVSLGVLAMPQGQVCVCVCHTLSLRVKRNLRHQQGGAEHSGDCTQRSYPLVPEAGPDQPCVPALVKNIASSFYQDHRLFRWLRLFMSVQKYLLPTVHFTFLQHDCTQTSWSQHRCLHLSNKCVCVCVCMCVSIKG